MSSLSDDDEQAVPPSPRAVTPPPSAPVGVEMRERQWMQGATTTMPDSMGAAPIATARVVPSMIA